MEKGEGNGHLRGRKSRSEKKWGWGRISSGEGDEKIWGRKSRFKKNGGEDEYIIVGNLIDPC